MRLIPKLLFLFIRFLCCLLRTVAVQFINHPCKKFVLDISVEWFLKNVFMGLNCVLGQNKSISITADVLFCIILGNGRRPSIHFFKVLQKLLRTRKVGKLKLIASYLSSLFTGDKWLQEILKSLPGCICSHLLNSRAIQWLPSGLAVKVSLAQCSYI